jgi:hypothetical protein
MYCPYFPSFSLGVEAARRRRYPTDSIGEAGEAAAAECGLPLSAADVAAIAEGGWSR